MGRPLNSKFFGPSGISVRFHDGDSITSGYILEQLGSHRYQVSNGTISKACELAQTTLEAMDPTDNLCTILVETENGTEYVKKLMSCTLRTTTDKILSWRDDVISDKQGSIHRYS